MILAHNLKKNCYSPWQLKLAKNLKTENDLSALSRELVKLTVETVLGKEMEEHLGYAKHSTEGRGNGNICIGTPKKTLKGQIGEVQITTLRDRLGTAESCQNRGKTRVEQ